MFTESIAVSRPFVSDVSLVLTRYDLTAEPLIGGQQEAIARLRLRPLYTFGRDSDAVALACQLYDGCRALLEEESRMAS